MARRKNDFEEEGFDILSCLVEAPKPGERKRAQPTDGELTFGYPVDELREAFTRIQDKANWKNHIDTVVDEEGFDFELHNAACIFMTGSQLEITGRPAKGKIRLYAAGYYNTIGA